MTNPQAKAAIRSALATYLQTYLAAAHPTLVVSDRWPTPGKPLPEKAITVVTPGGDEDVPFAPTPVRVVPGDTPDGDVTYSVGMLSVGLQLDCWAQFAPARDALAADVWRALNRPPEETIAGETRPHLGAMRGLVIRVTGLYNTPCDFRFEPVPNTPEASDAMQSGEFRATWQGTATLHNVAQETLPLIQQVRITLNS